MNRSSIFYIVAACAVGLYVIFRAVLVPVSHDEAVTFLLYVQSGNFLPWNMVWDANNHILNSALMWPCWKLLGMEAHWLRMPNVISFGVYAWFGWRLLGGLRQKWVWAIAALAWLSPALLIDFFAQMRGYGLSIALLSGALWHLVLFSETGKASQQIRMWLWLTAAVLANMSMLNSLLIAMTLVVALLWFRFAGKGKQWTILALLGLLPFIGLSVYALAMRDGGLLYYGLRDGFVEVTVVTLLRYTIYQDALWLAWLLAIPVGVAALWLFAKWVKGRFQPVHAGHIASAFLVFNVLGAVAMCYLLEVNYPEDRTGIYFLPLSILSLAYAADALGRVKVWAQGLVLPLLAFPIGLLSGANMGYTHLWREIHQHPGLYAAMAKDIGERKEIFSIEGYRLMMTTWGYESLKHKEPLQPFIPEAAANGRADYLMCHRKACDPYVQSHDTLFKDPRNETYLLKRRTPVQWEHYASISELPPPYEGNALYINLWESTDSSLIAPLEAIEFDFSLHTSKPMPLAELIVSARNANDETIYYLEVGLSWIKPHYEGDTLHLRRIIDLPEGTAKMVCYIWNMTEKPIGVTVHDIRLLRTLNLGSAPVVESEIVLSHKIDKYGTR